MCSVTFSAQSLIPSNVDFIRYTLMCTVLVRGKACQQYNCKDCSEGTCWIEWPDTGNVETTHYDIGTFVMYQKTLKAAIAHSVQQWNPIKEEENTDDENADEEENAEFMSDEQNTEEQDTEEHHEENTEEEDFEKTLVRNVSRWATWVFFNHEKAGIDNMKEEAGKYWLNVNDLVRVAWHNFKTRSCFEQLHHNYYASELDTDSMKRLLVAAGKSKNGEERWKVKGDWKRERAAKGKGKRKGKTHRTRAAKGKGN